VTNAERVILNLLDAGWVPVDVQFDLGVDPPTVTFVVKTPPIAVTDSPDYDRLIALAMGGVPKEH
jgi:hypothetical protein